MAYRKKLGLSTRLGVFHQDFEAQYQATTEFVEEMFERYLDGIKPYWVCQPMIVRTALSNYQVDWCAWDDRRGRSFGFVLFLRNRT